MNSSQTSIMKNTDLMRSTQYGRKAKGFITNLLISKSRIPWFIFSLICAAIGFFSFALLSPWQVYNFFEEVFIPGVIFASFFSFIALGLGFFDRPKRFNGLLIWQLGVSAGILAFSLTMLVYFLLYWRVGRYTVLLGSFGACFTPVIFHFIFYLFLRGNPFCYVTLGMSSIMDELNNAFPFNKQSKPYKRISEIEENLASVGMLSFEDVVAQLNEKKVAAVVLSEAVGKRPELLELGLKLMQAGFQVTSEISFYSEIFERFPENALSEKWLVFSGIGTQNPINSFVKRMFDIFLSLTCLILFAPLLLIIACMIKLTGKGPVIFKQQRPGRYCQLFKIYKFRTMTFFEAGPNSTQVKDPRVTHMGKILRPLHLDELPQLWNILKGEMSFVGPRPEVASFYNEIKKQIPIYELRYLIRPGLTGPAQINQGYTDHTSENYIKDTMEKLAYDLYYLKNYNIFLDLLIMLRTIFFLAKQSR